MGRRSNLVVAAGVLPLLIALPLIVADLVTQNVFILTVLFAALSQSWNILGGYCAQISLGHVLYFGVGAYVSTMLLTRWGITPLAGMLVGGVINAALAVAVGWPCFRLRGHYFAIATIVIAEIG